MCVCLSNSTTLNKLLQKKMKLHSEELVVSVDMFKEDIVGHGNNVYSGDIRNKIFGGKINYS